MTEAFDYKLRVETTDGYHVYSCDFRKDYRKGDLEQEINQAIKLWPRRRAAGLLRKTNLLKDQN